MRDVRGEIDFRVFNPVVKYILVFYFFVSEEERGCW
jgi:hypothetical protein